MGARYQKENDDREAGAVISLLRTPPQSAALLDLLAHVKVTPEFFSSKQKVKVVSVFYLRFHAMGVLPAIVQCRHRTRALAGRGPHHHLEIDRATSDATRVYTVMTRHKPSQQ
ncbi:hypothetical protein TESG_01352 [Trichophyton tonsurans CBS 112818]|uniref:Uncharacterized protein n=1 Tax=Trichophyton tonsurans (strain CBS 112818) TaxID=647933 RepID=F2RRB0_TRIT1|nr:hypothetical protein TESG_01352 [Trichophyton tonsurans CBS 112818]